MSLFFVINFIFLRFFVSLQTKYFFQNDEKTTGDSDSSTIYASDNMRQNVWSQLLLHKS